ncbi:putative ABC transporter [Enterococcus faecalis 13-SD-W-01]|nr:putative ABC transporter [Enterococcus faecalis 13-SD-W-01]
MIRLNAVCQRVIHELIRDKRTLALMLIAPMFILTLMNIVFDANGNTDVRIGVDQTIPAEVKKALPSDDVSIKSYTKEEDIEKTVKNNELDAFITLKDDAFHITYENADPSKTAQIKNLFRSALTGVKIETLTKEVQKAAQTSGQPLAMKDYSIQNSYIYGDGNSTFFDKIFPILIGFFIFFFVFLVSGIALLKERTSGTLERLLATPIKRSEVIFGYLAGYGLFAIIQTVLIVAFSIFVLDLEIAGNIGWVLVTAILLALVALSMGIFVSTFANSEFQMVQFIPVIVVPQIFFSGLIPLETMADWVKEISYIFPLKYAGDALSNVILKGQGLADIWLDLLILFLFIVVFTVINIVGMRRYRKV